MIFSKLKPRAQDAPWDGGRIAIRDLAAPVAVCTREGELQAASPVGLAILRRLGVNAGILPAPMPHDLWQAMSAQSEGQPITWRPAGESGASCFGLTRHPLGSALYLVHIEDISTRNDTITLRLHHQQQQELARFAATVAHELRTPLGNILFNGESLLKRWRELSLDQIQLRLEEILAACRWQCRYIDTLIDGATARVQPDSCVQVGPLFDRIREVVRPSFRDRSHVLVIDVDRSLRVHGTPMLLEHVFANLLRNAIEAARDPITVTIHGTHRQPASASARAKAPRGHLRFLVADTGPGIPPHVRAHIFEPFFTTKASGNGIGLTLARQTVRDLGGDLRLISADRGTCFEILLAVAAEPPADPSA